MALIKTHVIRKVHPGRTNQEGLVRKDQLGITCQEGLIRKEPSPGRTNQEGHVIKDQSEIPNPVGGETGIWVLERRDYTMEGFLIQRI